MAVGGSFEVRGAGLGATLGGCWSRSSGEKKEEEEAKTGWGVTDAGVWGETCRSAGVGTCCIYRTGRDWSAKQWRTSS